MGDLVYDLIAEKEAHMDDLDLGMPELTEEEISLLFIEHFDHQPE